ncbi:hypothetical protein L345_15237, partial [Ophiophagus hannah]
MDERIEGGRLGGREKVEEGRTTNTGTRCSFRGCFETAQQPRAGRDLGDHLVQPPPPRALLNHMTTLPHPPSHAYQATPTELVNAVLQATTADCQLPGVWRFDSHWLKVDSAFHPAEVNNTGSLSQELEITPVPSTRSASHHGFHFFPLPSFLTSMLRKDMVVRLRRMMTKHPDPTGCIDLACGAVLETAEDRPTLRCRRPLQLKMEVVRATAAPLSSIFTGRGLQAVTAKNRVREPVFAGRALGPPQVPPTGVKHNPGAALNEIEFDTPALMIQISQMDLHFGRIEKHKDLPGSWSAEVLFTKWCSSAGKLYLVETHWTSPSLPLSFQTGM